MKKIIGFLSFVFSLVILFSCEPGRDANGDLLFGVNNPNQNGGGGTGGGASGNTRLIKKFTVTDSDGNVSTTNYTYTDAKLTSVVTSSSDNTSTKIDITYNMNLVSKIIHFSTDDNGQSVTSTLNMVHDGNMLAKINEEQDFGAGEILKSNTTITYNGNKVLKIERNTFDNATPPKLFSTISSDLTFAGDNISKWVYTVAFASNGPITLPPLVVTANLSDYDNKKNPFVELPKELNIAYTFLDSGGASVLGLSTNNPKRIMADGQTAIYNYTYNSDGYPTSGVSDLGKFSYEYY